ncbi:MAG TPA: hypothetical protein PK867_23905, partial [Pirellulales bacterium]|nr:hypothetical protein [Pirellulales bacterium]
LAGIAVAAFGVILAHALGVDMVFWRASEQPDVPFVTDSFVTQTTIVSFCLAVGLAVKQTLAESMRGTWLWLLHRPATRGQLIALKVATGGAIYLAGAGLPIVFYACWAAWPRTHASPFYWSMTESAWQAWGIVALMYLGTFLSALRPGRWMGTRLLPVAGTFTLAATIYDLFQWGGSWFAITSMWALLVLLGAALVASIQHVGGVRDFS